jgi:hypothetical protein
MLKFFLRPKEMLMLIDAKYAINYLCVYIYIYLSNRFVLGVESVRVGVLGGVENSF